MGYGGSPTGPDSWTSDRLSSSASVFRSVVFTSPDDNHVRPARRSTHAPHAHAKKLSSRTANRTSRTIRNRVSLSRTECKIMRPRPPPAPCARRGSAVAARTRRLYSGTYLPVNVTLSSSASAHPATQHAPGARYRGTAAALQLPYPCPNGPHGHAQHKGRTEAT